MATQAHEYEDGVTISWSFCEGICKNFSCMEDWIPKSCGDLLVHSQEKSKVDKKVHSVVEIGYCLVVWGRYARNVI